MGLSVGLITDRKAKSIRPGDKPFATGATGLWLHPSSRAGHGRWIFRFVSPVTGKRRDMGMGAYPDVPVRSALERARIAREQMAQGIDPIDFRSSQKAIPTFEQAARKQWAILAPSFRNPKHRAQWIGSLEQHAFPAIGHVRVDKLTAAHFADFLNDLMHRVPETAKRVKMRCSVIMAACRANGFIPANPMDDVIPLLSTRAGIVTHQPAMPWQMVPAFIKEHLAGLGGAKAALLFCILTAARSGEVRGMTWGEIDFDSRLWIVPASRMKAGVEHRVPLSSQALAILHTQARLNSFVFPALRGGQLSDMALTAILRKTNAPSDAPGRVATVHGFRSSFRNWAADTGIDSDAAERALAHTISNKVRAAYERSDRLEARREVMRRGGSYATTI